MNVEDSSALYGYVYTITGMYQTRSYSTGMYQTRSYGTGMYQTRSYGTGMYQTRSYSTGMYQTRSSGTGIHLFSPANGIILCFWFQGGYLNYGVKELPITIEINGKLIL